MRTDIYAVKELDRTQCNGWCYVLMTHNKSLATQKAKDIRNNHSLGIIRQSKIVHPSQKIVDIFVLAGNTIR